MFSTSYASRVVGVPTTRMSLSTLSFNLPAAILDTDQLNNDLDSKLPENSLVDVEHVEFLVPLAGHHPATHVSHPLVRVVDEHLHNYFHLVLYSSSYPPLLSTPLHSSPLLSTTLLSSSLLILLHHRHSPLLLLLLSVTFSAVVAAAKHGCFPSNSPRVTRPGSSRWPRLRVKIGSMVM